MSKVVFGVDIGGTTVKLGMFDENRNLLDKWEIPTRTENEGSNILPDVAESIEKKILEKGLDKENVYHQCILLLIIQDSMKDMVGSSIVWYKAMVKLK